MKAQVFHGPGDLRFEDVPVPEPGPGEIVIRIEAALTCGTDVKVLRRGHPVMISHVPTVFGHEFAGTVARVGRGADIVMLTAGGAALLPWAAARVRDGGQIHYFAGGAGDSLPLPLADLYHRELTLSATYSSSPAELREAFGLLAQGKVTVDGLITHRLPLQDLAVGVELMRRQEAVKVYITP